MSRRYTRIRQPEGEDLPGHLASGLMTPRIETHEEMVTWIKRVARRDLETAQRILQIPDAEFQVDVVEGAMKMRHIREVLPETGS